MFIAGIGRTCLVLIACSLVLAACGGSAPSETTTTEAAAPVADEQTTAPPQATGEPSQPDSNDAQTGFEAVMSAIEGLDGQERIHELLRLAQEEGVVQIYSTMN